MYGFIRRGTAYPFFTFQRDSAHRHRSFVRASVLGWAWPQGEILVVVTNCSLYAWRAVVSMRILKRVHIRREGKAGTMPQSMPNRIADKLRRTSDVRMKVRAGRRHGPRVAVPCRQNQPASPDRLRASRYSFFVAICMVSLSEKSQHCVSVCRVYMQCLLAKWLILHLILSFGNSLDQSRICADRTARFHFQCLLPS